MGFAWHKAEIGLISGICEISLQINLKRDYQP